MAVVVVSGSMDRAEFDKLHLFLYYNTGEGQMCTLGERRGERERNMPVFEVCVSFGLLYGIHLFVEMLRIQVMGPTKHRKINAILSI